MQLTVQVNGMDALIVQLNGMQQKVPEKAIEIMHEVGANAKNEMDSHTPVRSGKLKDGNTLSTEEDGFTLSNAVEYAQYVEEGTRYMSAQPFLAPAVEYATQELNQRLPDALNP